MCERLLLTSETDFENRVLRIRNMIAPAYVVQDADNILPYLDEARLEEDIERFAQTVAVSVSYCMSVNRARTATNVFPVRANRGNFQNQDLVQRAAIWVLPWSQDGGTFSGNDLLGPLVATTRAVLTDVERDLALTDMQQMVADIVELDRVIRTYGNNPNSVPPPSTDGDTPTTP